MCLASGSDRSIRAASYLVAAAMIAAPAAAAAAPRAVTPYHKVTSYILEAPISWTARPATAVPRRAPASSLVNDVLALSQCSDCPSDDTCTPCGPGQRAAVEHALQIWNRYLASPVRLGVKVEFRRLAANVQGVHIPSTGYFGLSPNPSSMVVYPAPLASCIEGRSLNDPDPDIYLQLNRSLRWYEPTDGNPGDDERDLVTAVLHEVCHGLGVETSLYRAPGDAGYSWGYSDPQGQQRLWSVYDQLLTVKDETKLFKLEGPARLVQLNSLLGLPELLPSVVLGGVGTLRALLGGPLSVYYDTSVGWQAGSSLSHLDSVSHLMSHVLGPGTRDVYHAPEGAVVELLRALGWPVEPLAQARALQLACKDGAVEGTFGLGPGEPNGDVVDPDAFLVLQAPAGTAGPPAPRDGKLDVGDQVAGWKVVAFVPAPTSSFRDPTSACAPGTQYAVLAANVAAGIKNLRVNTPATASLP